MKKVVGVTFDPESAGAQFALEFVEKYLEEVANKNSEATFAEALNDLIGACLFTGHLVSKARQETLQ